MTYTLSIDQRFCIENGLSSTYGLCLAACMNLTIWADNITIDGKVWYNYTENKMVSDFPLLFSIPKRVYKNLLELSNMGFIETTTIIGKKYLTFTDKCKNWGRDKESSSSPKTDSESENGLKEQKNSGNSPKTDSDTIYINKIINNNINTKKESISYDIDEKESSVSQKTQHSKAFVVPTIEEVTQYCNERGNGIDPQSFIDFYESKGWMIGNSRMKDWKAAVRTWENKRKENNPQYQPKEKKETKGSGYPSDYSQYPPFMKGWTLKKIYAYYDEEMKKHRDEIFPPLQNQ